MKPRRVLEEVTIPAVIVAPYPVTVSQRNCFETFGLTKADWLRLVGRHAFPVKEEGQLRIALFADVEAYLTGENATKRAKSERAAPPPDPVKSFDSRAFFHKHGLRKG